MFIYFYYIIILCNKMKGNMMNLDWNEIYNECLELSIKAERQEIEKMINEGIKYSVNNDKGNTVGMLYDICGNAHVKFTDKRNKFAKEYKKHTGDTDTFSLYCKSSRQELRINKAVANAVVNHLNEKYNAKVYVRWYVD